MLTRYQRLDRTGICETLASTALPLFGRWCAVTVSTWRVAGMVILSMGVTHIDPDGDDRVDPVLASFDGFVRIPEGRGSGRRFLEQRLVVSRIRTVFVHAPCDGRGGVADVRSLARRLLDKTESLFETVRQSIRMHLAADELDRVVEFLGQRYGQHTRSAVTAFLGSLHWALLLEDCGLNEQGLGVLEYTLRNNPPRVAALNSNGEPHAATLSAGWCADQPSSWLGDQDPDGDTDPIADLRALALLAQVCGVELAEEYLRDGCIVIESQGYMFEISGYEFVDCVDPNGCSASLCVHTAGLTAHPIDEVALAYLSIKHTLRDYLKMAIVHWCDEGFTLDMAFDESERAGVPVTAATRADRA